MTSIPAISSRRLWLPPASARTTAVLAAAGLLWNLYGIVQFARTAGASRTDLERMGLSAQQAELYASLPAWMTLVFFIGVSAGTIGSVLLLARNRGAVPVLGLSLAAYGALFAGDVALGVFAAFGAPQVAVLTATVLAAAILLLLARGQARRAD